MVELNVCLMDGKKLLILLPNGRSALPQLGTTYAGY
jgi:hypothetical protein